MIKRYRKIALENACWLSLGGFQETYRPNIDTLDKIHQEDEAEEEMIKSEDKALRTELGYANIGYKN